MIDSSGSSVRSLTDDPSLPPLRWTPPLVRSWHRPGQMPRWWRLPIRLMRRLLLDPPQTGRDLHRRLRAVLVLVLGSGLLLEVVKLWAL